MRLSTAPLLRTLTLVLPLSLALPATMLAQSAGQDGERPGLVLVKPQAWSKPAEARVVEFVDYTDHSGYIELRTARSPKYQVPTAKIVKLIVYPKPPVSLENSAERASIQSVIDELSLMVSTFPSAARQINASAAPLKADAVKYDAGSVKLNGAWISRSGYAKQKANALADLIRPELTAAENIKEVDLNMNQYFIGLQNLAKNDPSVKPVVESIRGFYLSLVRKADRDATLAEVTGSGVGFERASDLIKKLEALKPEEDAKVALFIKSWKSAVDKAGELTKKITDARTEFEAAMTDAGATGAIPQLPPALSSTLGNVSDSVKAFRAGNPPSSVRVPMQLADAMLACAEKFPAMAKQIKNRELLDAKSVIDPLTNQAEVIGPQTAKVFQGIQKQLTDDVLKFQSLRNEAKMLAENDKIEEALKKYEAAYAIIPAQDVATQIDTLKKQ